MTAVLAAGGMRIDYLITQDGQAHTGLVGGNALYSAVGAALWLPNGQTGLWARIGQNYPQQWLEELERLGLDTTGLIRIPGHQDHRTFYAYTPDGRRVDTDPAAHFGRIGLPLPEQLKDYIHSTPGQDNPDHYEPLALRPEDWPQSFNHNRSPAGLPSAVHLAPLSIRTHSELPPFLRKIGIRKITVDPGERYMKTDFIPYLQQFLPQVDAFLPSAQEINSLFGSEIGLWEAAKILAGWGTPLVIVKNGAEGVLVYDSLTGQKNSLPPFHQPGDSRIIDTTGAGDAFCGGFLAGYNKTRDAVVAAEMGLVSASFALEGYGALYPLTQSGINPERRLEQQLS